MERRYTASDLAVIHDSVTKDIPIDPALLSKPRAYKNDESRMQVALVSWWAIACKGYCLPPKALKSSPISGVRDAKTGARLKREGARPGDPDLNLQVARGGFHGMYIELKTATGRLSPDQKEFIEFLQGQGYHAQVCRSLDEAVRAIVAYLSL